MPPRRARGQPLHPIFALDAAAICVSVDYLTRPVKVFRECGRVLSPRGPLVITFSNRCFPTKVIAAWRVLDDRGHQELVARYFAEAGNWTDIVILDRSPEPGSDPLWAVVARARARAERPVSARCP